ncbi:Heat shock factor protein 2 [Tulasnella sp. UAMH 9824]|nr:Heat shock factor protein 2 [Tulasnella sp. UAMH 9824]
MSDFILPLPLQHGLYVKEYFLADSSETTAEYLPPQPGFSSQYEQSFGLTTFTGWQHQGDAPLNNAGFFGVQGGESTLDDVNRVYFEESGFVAGPLDVQRMPSADEQHPNPVDDEEARPRGPFPCQLYSLMEDRRAAKLIYWDPEGKKIIVPDSEALENAKLLSVYFNHNKWSSVVRQLGSYGFTKGNRAQPGGTDHVYYHPNFLRGRKTLLNQIKSKSQGGDSGKSLVARLRKEIQEMEKKLACSERERKALEARNKGLDADNRTLKARLHGVLVQLGALQLQFLAGGASAVPVMPPNGFQAVSGGHIQTGNVAHDTLNNFSSMTTITRPPSTFAYTSPARHQMPSWNPLHGTSHPTPSNGRPMNAPVAPVQGGHTDTTRGSQVPGPSNAGQYAPMGSGIAHARGSVGQVSQQQAPSQGPWIGNWRKKISAFGSPSTQQ